MLLSPDVYVAVWLSSPTARVRVGLPLALSMMTDSLKMTDNVNTSPPAGSEAFRKLFFIPVPLVISTLLTVGALVSTS